MGQLADAGCVAFSQANAPLADTQVLWRALQYAATFGYPVWLRAEDAWLAKGGVAHDGEVATRLGLPGHSGVRRDHRARHACSSWCARRGARVHVCRLSTRRRGGAHAPREGGEAAGDLRRRHPSRAPLRHGPRLLRFALPPRAAAAQPARPRRARARRSPTAWSTACAPTTRRSTRTASTCRSPRPSPARPASSCCCRSR